MTEIIHKEICIIGFGPASIGAALELSNNPIVEKIIVIEAGDKLADKSCSILKKSACRKDKSCSIISGFGGSSVLGGSKLSDYPAGSKIGTVIDSDEATKKKFEKSLEMIENFVPINKITIDNSEIEESTKNYREKGFNLKFYDVYTFEKNDLIKGYDEIESILLQKGVDFRFNTVVYNIEKDLAGYKISAKKGKSKIVIHSKNVILGVGRRGYDLLEHLNGSLELNVNENPIDVGVRLEFPSAIFPDIDKSHGDLKLRFEKNQARTFCVCKGGKIAPYLIDDIYCTEGYWDLKNPTMFTNLAILVRIDNADYQKLIKFIKKQLEIQTEGLPVRQTYNNFLNPKNSQNFEMPSSINYWSWGDINNLFPEEISQEIRNAVTFFASNLINNSDLDEVTIFGPEIHRTGYNFTLKKDFSIEEGLYLVGECSGAFRGILQSFVSGVICAESIVEKVAT